MASSPLDGASTADESKPGPGCLFCRIARGEDERTELVHQDDRFAVFNDIKPAARHHYLVVPRNHHGNVKFMAGTEDDLQLIQDLVAIGRRMLEERNVDVATARFGFHWAPFHSVEHLHLHVIAPASEMGFIARAVFRPNSYWFVTSDWVEQRLKSLQATPASG